MVIDYADRDRPITTRTPMITFDGFSLTLKEQSDDIKCVYAKVVICTAFKT